MGRCMKELLKQHYTFWDELGKEEQDAFCSSSNIQSYKKGEFVHDKQEDCLGILLILKGEIRIYVQSDEGKEITLFRMGEGEVCTISAACIMREISFEIMIEASEDAELLVTGVPYIKRLMEKSLLVQLFMYKQMSEHFSDSMWALSEILFKSFDKRLAGYLEEARLKTGNPVISATHDEIARNMGSAREVVSRMLKYFEKEGLVELSRGTITIRDPGRLRKMI